MIDQKSKYEPTQTQVGKCTKCTIVSEKEVFLESYATWTTVDFENKMSQYPLLDKMLNEIPNFHFPKILSEIPIFPKKYRIERALGINIDIDNSVLDEFININGEEKIFYLTKYIEAISVINSQNYTMRDHKPDSTFIDTKTKTLSIADIELEKQSSATKPKDLWLYELNEESNYSLKNLLTNFFNKNSARSGINTEEYISPIIRTIIDNLSAFDSASDLLNALHEYSLLKQKPEIYSSSQAEHISLIIDFNSIQNKNLKRLLQETTPDVTPLITDINSYIDEYPTAVQTAKTHANTPVIKIESAWIDIMSKKIKPNNK